MRLPGITAVIGADTADLDRALDRATSRLRRFAGPAGIAAAVGALTLLTRNSMQAIDANAKLAQAVGGTTAAMQALQRAGTRAGVQQSELASAATRLNQRLGEVIATGKGADDTFKALGLTAQELAGMDVDQRFAAISDAMRRAGMSSQEMSYHLRQLGIRQSSMITLLQQGSGEIDKSREAIDRLGVAISEIDARKVEEANDAIAEVKRAFEGLGNVLATRFAPAIAVAAQGIANMVGAFNRLIRPQRDARDAQFDFLDELARTSGVAANAEGGLAAYREEANRTAEAARQAAEAQDRLNRALDAAPGPGVLLSAPQLPREGIEAFLDDPDSFGMPPPRPRPGAPPRPSRLAPTRSPVPRGRGVDDFPMDPVAGIGGGAAVADQMAERLQALVDGLRTEDEVIADWYQTSLSVLDDALSRRMLTEEEYREQRERLEKEHQDRLNAIRGAGDNTAMSNTKAVMEGMLGIVQAGGQRMIGAQKAISATLALINTWEGVSKALTLPWPQNFAVAARVLGQGMAAVQNIRSASAGGGGGSASLGGADASPVMRQNIIIDLVGEQFSRNTVRGLFDQINEGLRSGHQIEGIMVRT